MTETTSRLPHRSAMPAAVIDAATASPMPALTARCECGWNAVTMAPTVAEAQANLNALQRAHRMICPLSDGKTGGPGGPATATALAR